MQDNLRTRILAKARRSSDPIWRDLPAVMKEWQRLAEVRRPWRFYTELEYLNNYLKFARRSQQRMKGAG